MKFMKETLQFVEHSYNFLDDPDDWSLRGRVSNSLSEFLPDENVNMLLIKTHHQLCSTSHWRSLCSETKASAIRAILDTLSTYSDNETIYKHAWMIVNKETMKDFRPEDLHSLNLLAVNHIATDKLGSDLFLVLQILLDLQEYATPEMKEMTSNNYELKIILILGINDQNIYRSSYYIDYVRCICQLFTSFEEVDDAFLWALITNLVDKIRNNRINQQSQANVIAQIMKLLEKLGLPFIQQFFNSECLMNAMKLCTVLGIQVLQRSSTALLVFIFLRVGADMPLFDNDRIIQLTDDFLYFIQGFQGERHAKRYELLHRLSINVNGISRLPSKDWLRVFKKFIEEQTGRLPDFVPDL
uniref:Importin N-terminal domain-containing protein n=3 Tax=Caenorhabditis tropicalis TaxID=1561998 RepID=A0A1I7U068_9PELO